MTEEEAKTKWCPFARVLTDWENPSVIGPFNRDDIVSGSGTTEDIICKALCIGSLCMAWRRKSGRRDGGYCGLAGKP